jgi:hypothetical protein
VSTKLRVFSTTSFVRHYVRGLADTPLPLVVRDAVVDPDLADIRPWARYCTPSSVPPAYRDLVGWERFQEALAELVELGAQRGTPVVFLSFFASGEMPALEELGSLVFVEVRLGQADRLGDSVDAAGNGVPPVVVRGDPHPSARGHARIAGEIFRTLEERGVWARVAGRAQR